MVGIYARFIHGYADIVAVLHELKKKRGASVWRQEHEGDFDSLKRALCEAPVIKFLDFNRVFFSVTDASNMAISAVLHQEVKGALQPIAYHSRVMTAAELIYGSMRNSAWLSSSNVRNATPTPNIKNL